MNKKDYAQIFKYYVESRGYELLGEYKGVKTKTLLKCPEGHEWKVQPDNFKNGQNCPKCYGNCLEQANEQFIELADKEGYELLGEYINASTKVSLKCPNDHEWEITPNHFKGGTRCSKCSRELHKKEFIELIDDMGYEQLGEYKGITTKVLLKCPEGHEWETKPNYFKGGVRCPKCAGLCPEQANEQFIELADKEGYELLGEYINASTKVLMKCPDGHEWNVIAASFKKGHRCKECSNNVSKPEIEVQEYVRSLNINFIENDRTTILNQETGKYLELDLWFPEQKKAIEFNGSYWHSFERVAKNDQYKKEYCEWKGIDLFIIDEQDWYDNRLGVIRDIQVFLK